MAEPRVIRLTGAKGKIEWLHVNQPEVQPDGSVRFLNDITEEQADFVVSEQDFHATVRAAMFEQLMEMLQKLPPEISLKLLPQVLELSDIPNKEEFISELRQVLGVPKPQAQLSEEEQAQAAQAAQQAHVANQQQQAIQGQMAALQVADMKAQVALKEAQAEKVRNEADAVKDGSEETLRMLAEQVAHLAKLLQQRQTDTAPTNLKTSEMPA
jgi:hypothetical protein